MPRFVLALTVLGVLLTAAATGLSRQPLRRAGAVDVRQTATRPNIVFILADDLGYGHLGSYGQTKIRTPSLDRMAAEGLRFRQAYAGAPVCAPCRSTLMSGLHTGHTPIRSNDGGVPLVPNDLTVAEVLQRAGYRTGIFGKWGLGDAGSMGVPNKQGFDEFFGYLHQVHAHSYYPAFLWKNDRKVFLSNRDGHREEYSHDLIAAEALSFVRRNRDVPFFLYVPFTIPHAELLVPEDSLAEYDGEFPETPFTGEPPNPKPRATLAGMITRLDRSVGQILALLADLGLDERTIVFFTSDNGPVEPEGDGSEFFRPAGPFRGYKRSLYEGALRVPLIVRWPGRIRPGTVSEYVTAHWDFLPTAAELAGVPAPANLDGESIVPQLTSPSRGGARSGGLYWELGNWDEGGVGLRGQAARIRDWKAVRPERGASIELYDVGEDPAETRNLASARPDVLSELEQFIKASHRPPRPQNAYPPLDGRRYH